MIKKIILLFVIFGLFFGNIVNAGGRVSDYITDDIIDDRNLVNIKYADKKIKIGNILVNYNIGLKNDVSRKNIFIPIDINFSEKINGSLEIYIKNNTNSNYSGEKEKFYKKILINNSKNLNTYFFTGNYHQYNGDFVFYLNINNKKILLSSVLTIYSEDLYILNKGRKYLNNSSIDKIEDLFLLKQFESIYLYKNNLSNNELNILKKYLFSGGKLILEKDLFNKYFLKNNKVKKINYPKSYCDERYICDKNYYEFGFGKIFIKNRLNNYEYFNENIFLGEDEIKSILIDKVIESKFVPFYVILIFVVIYFIALLVVNFILPLKYKNNKFFFFYSIPSVSLFFLFIIIGISFIYRGFNDIENKLQINLHLDNKILKQVYIANFSVFGGDYSIKINKDYYSQNTRNYYIYNRNYSKKEINYNNNKITEKIFGLNSLSILYYTYSILENEVENNINNINKTYKSKIDLLNDYSIDKDKFLGYNNDYGLMFSRNIEKIVTRNIETDFMKKYFYGGIKNKNIVIDVFYK